MITLRLIIASMVLCGFIYVPAVLGFARIASPQSADGSLVFNEDGKVIGSRLIGQAFEGKRYFHSRPSACDFNASAACGSNLSPGNPKLKERAEGILAFHQASRENPLPADLVTASGSGLDPDITLEAAIYQVPRIAMARGIPDAQVRLLVDSVKRPLMGRLGGPQLVNVLELNLALDAVSP